MLHQNANDRESRTSPMISAPAADSARAYFIEPAAPEPCRSPRVMPPLE